MHFVFENVNDAFYTMVDGIDSNSIPTVERQSRNGTVKYIDEPTIITYENPREKVLFNRARDANPFFHLFEFIWMVSGSNLIEPLCHFNSNMKNFSDNGVTFHGAYGHRWRNWKANYRQLDQLEFLIEALKQNPSSRRAMLQMWNPEIDIDAIVFEKTMLDVPCNFSIQFQVTDDGLLDMTVFNRSNDLIWGCLGANVVHFSLLQELVAEATGFVVGRYHQVSNNLHVYSSNWKPNLWLSDKTSSFYEVLSGGMVNYQTFLSNSTDFKGFTDNCMWLVNNYDNPNLEQWGSIGMRSNFLRCVVVPMILAFNSWKIERNYEQSFAYLQQCKQLDWRVAGTNWLKKRQRQDNLKEASKNI